VAADRRNEVEQFACILLRVAAVHSNQLLFGGFGEQHLLYEFGDVIDVDGGHLVHAVVEHFEVFGVVQPGLFEPVEQDVFSVALSQSARNHLTVQVRLLFGEIHAAGFK